MGRPWLEQRRVGRWVSACPLHCKAGPCLEVRSRLLRRRWEYSQVKHEEHETRRLVGIDERDCGKRQKGRDKRWKGMVRFKGLPPSGSSGCYWGGRRTTGGSGDPKSGHAQGVAGGGGEGGLTDVGVASDLAKDVCLPPRGFPHLLQLLRTQPLSCHLHDLHGKLMASGSVNASADHRAHSSARARERGQGSCSPCPMRAQRPHTLHRTNDPSGHGSLPSSCSWPTQLHSSLCKPPGHQHGVTQSPREGRQGPGLKLPRADPR